jgi:hypothetical protein
MFRRKTLFIVGAGASAEFDLPLGIRFERGFNFIGSGDQRLYDQLVRLKGSANEWQAAAMRIRDGLPFAQSIDDFLDQRRTDTWINLYGKAAICQAILEAERESKLYFNRAKGDEPFNANAIADTWLAKFMYMLCRGVPRENVAHLFEQLDFIVFNYDRCLEHFLISGLERAYSITVEDAASIVGKLDILHPYGSVGRLGQVAFGNSGANCVALAEQIKTYTEQADEQTVLRAISDHVERAECIVFLGFAYHSQNMQMLRTTNRSGKIVYGTALGMSSPDIGEVHKQIAQTLAPGEIHLDGVKCAALFDNYAKSLTGGD